MDANDVRFSRPPQSSCECDSQTHIPLFSWGAAGGWLGDPCWQPHLLWAWRMVRKDNRRFMYHLKMFSWMAPSLQSLMSCWTHFSTPSALHPYVHREKLGATLVSNTGSAFTICVGRFPGPPAPISFSAFVYFAQCPRSCSPQAVSGPGPPDLLPHCFQLGLAMGWRREKFLCSFPAGSGGRPWRSQLLLRASLD